MAGEQKARTVELKGAVHAKSDVNGKLMVGRSVPESLAAEAAVLGSMIIGPKCIGEVLPYLSREGFYRPEHQMILDALIALYEKNPSEAIDGVLLRDELQKQQHLEAIGGVDYLAKVMQSVPSAANVMYYAAIVKEKMLLRQMIAAATEILDQAYDQSGDTKEKLDEAERRIFAVTDQSISGQAYRLKDLVTQAYELIEKRGGTLITGLSTGYQALDNLTCGLQSGEMIVIAGRPSMGKTSLALNIAEHVGVVERMPLAIFSLETSRQQLAERFMASASEIDAQAVRKGMLTTLDHQKLVAICGQLSEAPIYIDDSSSLTPLELRAKARRLKSLYDIRAVFIDYLQLMYGGGKVESRQQEIATISRYIKGLARELSIPVVVLSQLNRAPEGREGHRPRMSDLRESGSIEQDADMVILLHREDYYHQGEEDYQPNNTAELIIAKQRNGPTGLVPLRFWERFTRFKAAAPVPEESVPF